MAGGTYTSYSKKRPGAYINVNAPQKSVGSVETTRGVVFFVGGNTLGWGPDGVIKLNAGSDFKKLLGHDIYADDASDQLKALRETLKAALTVLYYNINSGAEATYADEALPWKFTAKYPGTVGNNIRISVAKNAADISQTVVTTYFGTEQVDQQIVIGASQLESNDYIDVEIVPTEDDGKTLLDALTASITKSLAGGTTDTSAQVDTDALISAMEIEQFNTVTAAGNDKDAPIHQLLVATVQRLREDFGQKIVAVIPDGQTGADYEGVIVVANGVELSDGEVLSASIATGYVAGAEAAAAVNQSLTYAQYPGATAVNGRLSNDDTISALTNGKLLFTALRSGSVVIEEDINSLHTYSANKSKSLSKNRVMRVLDDIAQNTKDTFEASFIGKVNNDAAGRDLFKANRIEYLTSLVNSGAIQQFDGEDITVNPGSELDQVIVDLAVQPLDAMEKLYMTVTI